MDRALDAAPWAFAALATAQLPATALAAFWWPPPPSLLLPCHLLWYWVYGWHWASADDDDSVAFWAYVLGSWLGLWALLHLVRCLACVPCDHPAPPQLAAVLLGLSAGGVAGAGVAALAWPVDANRWHPSLWALAGLGPGLALPAVALLLLAARRRDPAYQALPSRRRCCCAPAADT